MSDGQFDGLYKAKLRDNGIEYSDEDYKRFCRQLERSFWQGILDLSGQRIGINILTKLTKVLRTAPHIRVFNFYGNLIRDHGMHSLLQLLMANAQVQVVDIGCNDLGNPSIPNIIDIISKTNVRSLQLGATGAAWHNNKFSLSCLADLINAIRGAGKIRCLGLSGLKMSTKEGAKRVTIADTLADYINDDLTLRSISICDCGFSLREEDIVTTQGLLSNNRLKFVDFHANQLGDPVGPNFLGQLGLMTKLSYLDIHSCNLSGNAGIALAETLNTPSNLTILNISDNYLGDEGADALFSVLLINQTLTEVNLAANRITSQSAQIISQVIAENKVLCNLNISQNPIGDSGAYAIADSISCNDALTRLVIASCRITDDGAIEIMKSLANNKTLRTFDISDNFLTRESGYQIIDAIKVNETLFKIDVSATQIDHFVAKAINDLCRRNRQIEKETGLQPLKKQMIQLSIQRTKMPEAEMRLQKLNALREELEREVMDTQDELDSTESTSNANILVIRKTIQSTHEMIEEEHELIKKIATDREKLIDEYEKELAELAGNCEKEKAITEKLEVDASQAEKIMNDEQEAAQKQQDEIRRQIEQLNEIKAQIIELTKDPEKVRDFEPPQLEISLEPTRDKFFLNDEILDNIDEEKKKKKKKKGKGKGKAKKGSKGVKTPSTSRKRKSSTKAEAPAPAQENINEEDVSPLVVPPEADDSKLEKSTTSPSLDPTSLPAATSAAATSFAATTSAVPVHQKKGAVGKKKKIGSALIKRPPSARRK